MNAVDRCIAAEKLPLGHTERKAAEKALRKEYGECSALERKVKLPRKAREITLSLKEAQIIVDKLWDDLGCSRKVRVYESRKPYCYCNGRNLYLWPIVGMDILLHELAHAIVWQERLSGVHNGDYLWVLKMLREKVSADWPTIKQNL